MAEHIYERDGELFVPTHWAGGPWSPEAQHGGPPVGLFTRMAERAGQESGLQLARLTVDLCRAVPRQPLRLAQRWLRRGRKLALLRGGLLRGDEEIAHASALLLAPRAELGTSWPESPQPAPPPPESAERAPFMPLEFREQIPPGFHFSVEARTTRDELGPFAWLTTPLELVAGEASSAQVRFGMLSDLTFAMGGRLALPRGFESLRAQSPFINADVTLYRERAPEGQWLGFRPLAVSDRAGIGFAEVVQFDRAGRIGRSLQALVASSTEAFARR